MVLGFAGAAAILQLIVFPSWAVAKGSRAPTETAAAATVAEARKDALHSADSSTYALSGTVVNSATGEPIRGALVQLYAGKQRSVRTGPDGRFQFEGLPAGTMATIVCRKPGFFSEEEIYRSEARIDSMQIGPDMAPVVLKLVPEGIIFGRISGEDGLPVENLPVHLLAKRVDNGEMRWFALGDARTNEDGEFRLAELQPGNYFLFLGPSQTPVVLPTRQSESGAKGFPAVFYPGVSDLSSAAPIQITPGKHAEILFSMSAFPFFRVSGSVGGYPHGQFVHLQFFNAAGEGISANARFDERSGEFQSGWLPAGSYTIKAFSTDTNGRQAFTDSRTLNVSSNVSGLHLSLVPGISIPVSMRVEATKSEPEPETNIEVQSEGGEAVNLGRFVRVGPPANVVLHLRGELFSQMQYAAEEVGSPENPSLAIQNIPPGTYSVEIQPNGSYYVQSAKSGSLDLLRKEITIAPGASVQPFEITLRDDGATLHVTFSVEANYGQAMVLLIPERGRGLEQGVGLNQGRAEFEFSQLAPGAYKVLAVDNLDDFEYRNPEVLQRYLSKAREITLEPNQSTSVALELVHIQE